MTPEQRIEQDRLMAIYKARKFVPWPKGTEPGCMNAAKSLPKCPGYCLKDIACND